jgi:chromosome segregation and condensation protein ScpB
MLIRTRSTRSPGGLRPPILLFCYPWQGKYYFLTDSTPEIVKNSGGRPVGVTNVWNILNLSSTPFFQDALEPGTAPRYPLSLFVGREREVTSILAEIGGAPSSRTAVQGAPGVGKTTLVNQIKAEATESGYIADATPISVVSADTAEHLLLAILTSVHDALAARDETLYELNPMRKVRQLLDLERTRSYQASINIPLTGGAGFGTSQQRNTGPGAIGVQPHRLLRDLSDIAVDVLRTPGVLIHLNNLENATEADQVKAARIIRDLRDMGLMYEGFHYLLAGTDDAIRTVVASQEQLRSVFHNPGIIEPLAPGDLDRLLRARYQHLKLPEADTWLEPVQPEAVHALYQIFRGNLRGTLHALNEAGKVLVGHGKERTDPMTLESMQPVLQRIYMEKMVTDLGSKELETIQAIGKRGPNAAVTQSEVTKIFRTTAKTTSETFASLRRKGYLMETGTTLPARGRGRPAQTYQLTGSSRIALGALTELPPTGSR